MNPLFFGASESPLFGIFEPAASDQDKDHAVLLCPPLGHEYFRTHWLLRKMAQQLTAAGYSVLRFDYFGYGDSAGDSGQGAPDVWSDNIATGVDELVAASGARCVSVVALRAACFLVADADLSAFDLDVAVMLDAPESGAQWLDDMVQLQDAHDVRAGFKPADVPTSSVDANGARQLMGAVFEDAALTGLAQMAWSGNSGNRFRKVIDLSSSAVPSGNGLSDAVSAWGSKCVNHCCEDATHWQDVAFARGPVLAQTIATEIVSLLGAS